MDCFYSLMFETKEKERASGDEPGFFSDLNITRIIDKITENPEYNEIRGFFYTLLKDASSVVFRQETMRALEDPELMGASKTFLYSQAEAARAYENSTRVKQRDQKNKWLLDSAALYCKSVRSLLFALKKCAPKAKALLLLSGFLDEYTVSEEFCSLEKDALDIQNAFLAIKYDIIFDEGRIFLDFESEEPGDLPLDIKTAFAPLAENSFDNAFGFFSSPELNPLERLIASVIKKRNPELFLRLGEAARRHPDFFDGRITRLSREFKFYIAFLEYAQTLKQNGMSFCFPEISGDKELRVYGGYDLALAGKAEKPAREIVCNDFYLDGDERVFILTGPNQGGKTTFARTFGQILFFAAVGCAAPCSYARVPLAGNILTHFAVEEDLSSHSGRLLEELLRLKEILVQADGSSIFIFNELFATTTTYDAVRLGARVLKRVDELGALCLYVSHITDLCDELPGAVSIVAEVVSPDNPERTYSIRRSKADGEAYADSIARKFGLSYREIMSRKGGAL